MNTDYMARMQRDEESLSAGELIAAYDQGAEDLRAAVAGMTREQVLARPIPGKWSTLEVVAHVAECEVFFADRIARTAAHDRPLLVGVDDTPYPSRLHYQELDLADQLNLVSAIRRRTGGVLRQLPADAWERTAVHTEAGLLTLRQLVLQPVRHIRHHLPFIAEKRAALSL
jgi:hypothetical protein